MSFTDPFTFDLFGATSLSSGLGLGVTAFPALDDDDPDPDPDDPTPLPSAPAMTGAVVVGRAASPSRERGENFHLVGDRGLAASWKGRARDNVEAIRLAIEIDRDGRPATAAEQERLARFIGFGASDLANGVFRRPGEIGFRKGWEERVKAGKNPLFQSHMWDGSAVPIDENLSIAQELLKAASAAKIILEVEIGVVGGEEDGVEAEINEKLYTSSEDFEKTIDALGSGENGKYLLAATFGNVHGVYKPGNVKLKPEVLAEGQKVAAAKLGLPAGAKPFDFVFHGGSGSLKSEIEDSLRYGVVKMNVDTDTQYAFTRPVAAHMFTNYDGVLKIDGEVGNKKVYDPRSYLKKAEASMTQRVIEACNDLHSTGRSVSAGLGK